MQHSTKLLFNTIASYARILVNTIVTLLATRIALKYLGADDFGLFNLIAGIVVLLSFINGSLLISSQRYFSITIGEKRIKKLQKYFNASLGIHFILASVISIILIAITPILFNGFLNINVEKITIAKEIYYIMIASTAFTIGTIPFSAIINAYEDLVALSLFDIISCFIKLFAAISLLYIDNNLLISYSLFMLFAVIIKMIMEIVWSKIRYKQVNLLRNQIIDISIYKEMLSFIGWNTLGSLAVLVRNQGIAIVLNIFFGTIVNAAYGIANQVNSLVLSFSSTLTTVFTPSIIQAKGAGDEKRMMKIAIFSSKMSFLLSSALALPILIFLKSILDIWLDTYPSCTIDFCKFIILSFLILQLYPGINRAIYANGNIKYYQISISIALILIIPIGTFCFKNGFSPSTILIIMFFSQLCTLFITIYFGHKLCKLSMAEFIKKSVIVPFSLFYTFFYICKRIPIIASCNITEIIICSIIINSIYFITFYFIALNHEERCMIARIIKIKR